MGSVLHFLAWLVLGGCIGYFIYRIVEAIVDRPERRPNIDALSHQMQVIVNKIAKTHNDFVSAQSDNNNLFMDRLNELHIRVKSLEGEKACQEVTEKSPTSLVVEYEPTQHSTSPRS